MYTNLENQNIVGFISQFTRYNYYSISLQRVQVEAPEGGYNTRAGSGKPNPWKAGACMCGPIEDGISGQ